MEHRSEGYHSVYVFSAEQQEEVKRIYQRYSPEKLEKARSAEEEKLERLRRLDKSVTICGAIAALSEGTVAALIHAAGIVLIQKTAWFIPGTVIALIGLALIFLAYPVFIYAEKRKRQSVEAEIISLCQELIK